MALFVVALALIGVGWFVVYRKERRDAAELARRREEFLGSRGPSSDAAAAGQPAWVPDPQPVREFRFAFSLKQLLITMTAAAVFLAVFKYINPKALTITLGALALVGLAVQTFGWFEPPPAVVLAWWILLVLYLAMGLLIALIPSLADAGPGFDPSPPVEFRCFC